MSNPAQQPYTPGFVDPALWHGIEGRCRARYIECRLQAQRREVDYLMAISRSAAAATSAALALALADAASPVREQWQPLLRLFQAFADGCSRISLQSPTIWLEFDDIQGSDACARTPSVSVCLTPSYSSRQATFPNDAKRDVALIDALLALLDVSSSDALRRLISECFRLLPEGSRWIHFSAMIAREPRALKLYGVFPRRQLARYLDALGWNGERTALDWLLREMYPVELLGELVFVDLNLSTLSDHASATLGLAVAQQHLLHGPDTDPRRAEILRRWCAAGLASDEKVGHLHTALAGDPASSKLSALRPGRFLDLKLVWSAAAGTIAKGYLGFHGQSAELPWR